jgi:hypothetical protein
VVRDLVPAELDRVACPAAVVRAPAALARADLVGEEDQVAELADLEEAAQAAEHYGMPSPDLAAVEALVAVEAREAVEAQVAAREAELVSELAEVVGRVALAPEVEAAQGEPAAQAEAMALVDQVAAQAGVERESVAADLVAAGQAVAMA